MKGWWTTLRKLFSSDIDWEAIPYEELFRLYQTHPQQTTREFARRLHGVVFFMAVDSCCQSTASLDEAGRKGEELTASAFEEFVPRFDKGDPTLGLVRFAEVLRSVLGKEAFERNSVLFYRQLLLYYLQDPEERQFLLAVSDGGLSSESLDGLADRFKVSTEHAEKVLQSANSNIARICREEFSAEEIDRLTEGRLRCSERNQ